MEFSLQIFSPKRPTVPPFSPRSWVARMYWKDLLLMPPVAKCRQAINLMTRDRKTCRIIRVPAKNKQSNHESLVATRQAKASHFIKRINF